MKICCKCTNDMIIFPQYKGTEKILGKREWFMKKKLLAAMLAAAMVSSLAACGGGSSGGKDTAQGSDGDG